MTASAWAPGSTDTPIYPLLLTFDGASRVGFSQSDFGGITETVQDKLRQFSVTPQDFGPAGTGVADSSGAVQAAMNALIIRGGGRLYFPQGTYNFPADTKISITSSNIWLDGDGMGVTIIKRTSAGGTALIEVLTPVDTQDTTISNMTIDCNLVNSGIQVQYVTRFTIRNCRIINNAFWGVYVGITNGLSAVLVNSQILVDSCFFSGAQSTFENLLLFNSKRVTVNNCFLENSLGTPPALGLYQNLENVTISNSHFVGGFQGLYYGISTNDISIKGCSFTSTVVGIQGANLPDNGSFGYTEVKCITISDCMFQGNDTGAQLGAVKVSSVSNCIFRQNISNALVINYGNAPVSSQPSHLTISNCQFADNNAGAGTAILHPGVLFSGGGGTEFVTFHGCNFIDTSGIPRQLYAVVFNGAFNWSGINFFGCVMNGYGAGKSIEVSGGATLTGVKLYGCLNLTTLPAGTTLV